MSEDAKLLTNEKTKTGLEILEASVLLGILGDVLLRSVPLGINVFLWMIVFAAAIAALVWRRRTDLRDVKWFFIPLVLFSSFFAWRDSNALMFLNVIAVLATFMMITLKGQNLSVRLAGFFQYAFGAFASGLNAVFAPFILLFGDIKWKTMPRGKWTKHILATLRGLAIAVPIVLIFGGLFMAADAVFEDIVKETLNIDVDVLISHIFLIGFFSWTIAGFLRGALIKTEILQAIYNKENKAEDEKITDEQNSAQSPIEKVIHQSEEPIKPVEKPTDEKKERFSFSLGLTEISIVLGLMNLLFLSFVIVQIRYFFGGAALVQQVTNLTYAEYARRGFFELVWVALLVLPILLIIEFLLRKDNPLNVKVFRWLAGGQIALLFVIMSSALSRMFLYQSEYGLTELRVYTTAFMFWLAVVFVFFCATVLIGKRERFAFTTYISALVFVAALHFVNPDNLISRVNLERLSEGKHFDAQYVSTLSADAIPVLIGNLSGMTPENRCIVQKKLLRRKDYEAAADWRSWSWARQNAWKNVETQMGNWNLEDCPKPPAVSLNQF